jgi:hypothetical protein
MSMLRMQHIFFIIREYSFLTAALSAGVVEHLKLVINDYSPQFGKEKDVIIP